MTILTDGKAFRVRDLEHFIFSMFGFMIHPEVVAALGPCTMSVSPFVADTQSDSIRCVSIMQDSCYYTASLSVWCGICKIRFRKHLKAAYLSVMPDTNKPTQMVFLFWRTLEFRYLLTVKYVATHHMG